jgi:hypothetical protein
MRLGFLVTPLLSNMFPRFELVLRCLLKDWPFRRFSAIFLAVDVLLCGAWSYIWRLIRMRLDLLVTPVPSNMFPRFELSFLRKWEVGTMHSRTHTRTTYSQVDTLDADKRP